VVVPILFILLLPSLGRRARDRLGCSGITPLGRGRTGAVRSSRCGWRLRRGCSSLPPACARGACGRPPPCSWSRTLDDPYRPRRIYLCFDMTTRVLMLTLRPHLNERLTPFGPHGGAIEGRRWRRRSASMFSCGRRLCRDSQPRAMLAWPAAWSSFHWRVILGLGAAWILAARDPDRQQPPAPFSKNKANLHLTSAEVGTSHPSTPARSSRARSSSASLRQVRPEEDLRFTLSTYLLAAHQRSVVQPVSMLLFLSRRTGIGGEYTTRPSTPRSTSSSSSHYRGRTDMRINGTYWAGAISAPPLDLPAQPNRTHSRK